jgi:hypothetical protein
VFYYGIQVIKVKLSSCSQPSVTTQITHDKARVSALVNQCLLSDHSSIPPYWVNDPPHTLGNEDFNYIMIQTLLIGALVLKPFLIFFKLICTHLTLKFAETNAEVKIIEKSWQNKLMKYVFI